MEITQFNTTTLKKEVVDGVDAKWGVSFVCNDVEYYVKENEAGDGITVMTIPIRRHRVTGGLAVRPRSSNVVEIVAQRRVVIRDATDE